MTPETKRYLLHEIAQSDLDIEERAVAYVTVAHMGQKRPYTNQPYILHVIEVYQEVCKLEGSTQIQRLAALFHDVVEDHEYTGVTLDDVRRGFGDELAVAVAWLTDVSTPADGNRAARKAKDREHSAAAPGDLQTVKLYDVKSNAKDIAQQAPKFAAVYLPEKKLLVERLDKGDPALRAEVAVLIEDNLLLLKATSPSPAWRP